MSNYIVIVKRRIPAVELEAEEMMDRGWKPVGGITPDSQYNDGSGQQYLQTMIKTEE